LTGGPWSGGAGRQDVPEWRAQIREDVGEDPGRWLARDLLDDPGGDMDSREWLATRIDGIDRLDVLRAWLAVERRLANERGRAPREPVLELLEDREQELEREGDRWERLDRDAIPDHEERIERRTAEDYRRMREQAGVGVPTDGFERLEQLADAREQDASDQADQDQRDPLQEELDDLADGLDPVPATDGGTDEERDDS
jgi:hypothetical protein